MHCSRNGLPCLLAELFEFQVSVIPQLSLWLALITVELYHLIYNTH